MCLVQSVAETCVCRALVAHALASAVECDEALVRKVNANAAVLALARHIPAPIAGVCSGCCACCIKRARKGTKSKMPISASVSEGFCCGLCAQHMFSSRFKASC